jgi:hypothetical protein
MIVSDYILQVKEELQEKNEQWSLESLFVKLKAAYRTLQSSLPYFLAKESIEFKEGKSEYFLNNVFLKDVLFQTEDGKRYKFSEIENLFINTSNLLAYSYHDGKLLLNKPVEKDGLAEIRYKYRKNLETMNCAISLPENYIDALTFIFKHKIHEKPTRNTKERDLSKYYLSLYNAEVEKIRKEQKIAPRNLTSKYQMI